MLWTYTVCGLTLLSLGLHTLRPTHTSEHLVLRTAVSYEGRVAALSTAIQDPLYTVMFLGMALLIYNQHTCPL
jgi:hypothetical protein